MPFQPKDLKTFIEQEPMISASIIVLQLGFDSKLTFKKNIKSNQKKTNISTNQIFGIKHVMLSGGGETIMPSAICDRLILAYSGNKRNLVSRRRVSANHKLQEKKNVEFILSFELDWFRLRIDYGWLLYNFN